MKESLSRAAYLKSPYRSVKHSSYFAVYDELFAPFRNRDITFVEVGVLSGGSLFMWREFFGPRARIIGVDLNPRAVKWEGHGFEILIGSQSDPEFWNRLKQTVGPIDILLDDGGHTYEQQIITVESMLDSLRDGGLLVVEDTHSSYMVGFGPRRFSFMRYVSSLIDRINERSGVLDRGTAERRVWSVRIYESIVAFMIRREESEVACTPTDNGGVDDTANDFRHAEDPAMMLLNRLVASTPEALRRLFKRPLGQWIYSKLQDTIVSRRFAARKYFT